MAASLGNAVGAIGGVAKFFEGRKMQKEARKKIDNFKWQDLENSYENVQVSTLGADLKREENARMAVTAVDAMKGGGNRALVGGLGRVVAQNNAVNREIAVNLDEQQKAIDMAVAADDGMIRAMMEKRQGDELQGYGQMMNVGMNMKYGGIADFMNAAQAQGQTNMAIMDRVMGGMSGGAMGGSSTQSPVTGTYGSGMSGGGGMAMNYNPSLYGGNANMA